MASGKPREGSRLGKGKPVLCYAKLASKNGQPRELDQSIVIIRTVIVATSACCGFLVHLWSTMVSGCVIGVTLSAVLFAALKDIGARWPVLALPAAAAGNIAKGPGVMIVRVGGGLEFEAAADPQPNVPR